MSTKAAYLAVIAIWSTTPLAIKFSNDSLSPYAAVSLRMVLGLVFLLFIASLLRTSSVRLKNWKTYFAASLSMFPNMVIVYWAAQYIPSGIVSVLFGLTPFFSGIASIWLLKDNPFNARRILALLIAVSGLVLIFYDQMNINQESIKGIVEILISNALFSISGVWVKKLSTQVAPLEQTTGALLIAVPGFIVSWIVFDGQIPLQISSSSLYGTLYLAIFGTIVGYLCFFYILKILAVEVVSLIPLITPALALQLGSMLGGEAFGWRILVGSGMIITALAFYEKWSWKRERLPALKTQP